MSSSHIYMFITFAIMTIIYIYIFFTSRFASNTITYYYAPFITTFLSRRAAAAQVVRFGYRAAFVVGALVLMIPIRTLPVPDTSSSSEGPNTNGTSVGNTDIVVSRHNTLEDGGSCPNFQHDGFHLRHCRWQPQHADF